MKIQINIKPNTVEKSERITVIKSLLKDFLTYFISRHSDVIIEFME